MNGKGRTHLRAAYDAQAEARDSRELPEWKQVVRGDVLAFLKREGSSTLLEIGAGPGHDGAFFLDHGLRVVCVDLSREMVQRCRSKGLEAHVMDATDLQFKDGSFDAAYAFNSFLHLAEAELCQALLDVQRILRPEGVFFLGLYGGFRHEGVWEEDTYSPKRHFSFHTDDQLLKKAEEAFDVLSFAPVPVKTSDSRLHFQSLTLRRKSV